MKRIMLVATLISAGSFADKACKYSDPARLKEHLEKHIKYPSTGKAIKAACVKEWPDEFTDIERACCNKHLGDAAQFKSASEVEKALGVE